MGSNCETCKKHCKGSINQNKPDDEELASQKLETLSLKSECNSKYSFHRRGPSYLQFDDHFHPAKDMQKNLDSSLESIQDSSKKFTLKIQKPEKLEKSTEFKGRIYRFLNQNNKQRPNSKSSLQSPDGRRQKKNSQKILSRSPSIKNNATLKQDQRCLNSELYRKKKESQFNQSLFKYDFNSSSPRDVALQKKKKVVSQYNIAINLQNSKGSASESTPQIKINGRVERKKRTQLY